MSVVTVTFRRITAANLESVLTLRTTQEQERFVSSIANSMAEAAVCPEAKPWYRAVYADERPVGFVMLSWNVEPQPPDIKGPWFLWKLLIDYRHQRQGYGQEVVRQVVDLVRANGGTELLTSYEPGKHGPAGFYSLLGFTPTGDIDPDGEVIMRLDLRS